MFNGTNPVQPGVTAGAILPQRISIVRGRVLTPDGSPLPGVTVDVVGHPELGHTLSRNDGQFDLAINGGQDRRLRFAFAGCPTVQRPVRAQWESFARLDDVAMTPFDTAATAIDLSNTTSIQVARGSVRGDSDGPRRVTLLFPPSMTAQMLMPSGTTQPLTHLTVRATEFSVGALGKAAMPAALPPQAGYGFAADI